MLESVIHKIMKDGKIEDIEQVVEHLLENNCFYIALFIVENMQQFFQHSIRYQLLLANVFHRMKNYPSSLEICQRILNSPIQSRELYGKVLNLLSKNLNNVESLQLPAPENPKLNHIPIITFSITTCKRYDLFEKTMNSFLYFCLDKHLIGRWICVDDGSSESDRQKMRQRYPFFEWVWKDEKDKGHAKSMNIILDMVKTPYLFHMEDDWEFYIRKNYISECLSVLQENERYGQCLVNKNYAELFNQNIVGGIQRQTQRGLFYLEHDFIESGETFQKKYGIGSNCAYWPHYSLRPGLNRVEALKKCGTYNPNVGHFEMDFAYRYVDQGWKTVFLDHISCKHIGRLTSERNNVEKSNAYSLNNEQQFGNHILNVQGKVVNLGNRQDRWINFLKMNEEKMQNLAYCRFDAVNGDDLIANRFLEQLFNDNDYNYRSRMIGCALSHLLLWEECSKQQKIYLILEDDSIINVDLHPILSQLLNNKSWDILFLGHHKYTKQQNQEMNLNIQKLSKNESLQQSAGGTFGYLITPQGSEKMLQFIQERGMTNGIDTMMQHACDELNVYYSDYSFVKSEWYNVSDSKNIFVDTDIQKNHDSLRRDHQLRLIDEQLYLEKKNIPCQVCESFEKLHSSNCVTICVQQCIIKDFTTETVWIGTEDVVHIPKQFQNRYFQEYRMKKDGEWNVDQLISKK